MYMSVVFAAISALSLAMAQIGTIDGPVIPGTTGKLGDAKITTNNPAGVTYTAFLPTSNSTGIRGYIAATSNANGTGVNFNVNLYGFPSASLGPFCKLSIVLKILASWTYINRHGNSVSHPRSAGSFGW